MHERPPELGRLIVATLEGAHAEDTDNYTPRRWAHWEGHGGHSGNPARFPECSPLPLANGPTHDSRQRLRRSDGKSSSCGSFASSLLSSQSPSSPATSLPSGLKSTTWKK